MCAAGCIDTGLPAGRRYFGQSDKPLVETAYVHHARWVMFTETRCATSRNVDGSGGMTTAFNSLDQHRSGDTTNIEGTTMSILDTRILSVPEPLLSCALVSLNYV
jgi:hypothetical protein